MSRKIDPIEAGLLPEFLKIPYKHRGREFDGADCYGLIILWYAKRLGLAVWDVEEDYAKSSAWGGKNYFLDNYWREWRQVDEPGQYDVVLFRRQESATHAGVYLGSGKFLHIIKAGCVISKLYDPQWADRVEGFYRLRARDES